MEIIFSKKYYEDLNVGIKNGDALIINYAGTCMFNAISSLFDVHKSYRLVPVPSHSGVATTSLKLARSICAVNDKFDITVDDVLKGKPRPSLYDQKKKGKNITDKLYEFRATHPIGNDSIVVLVDNTYYTGQTIEAARKAIRASNPNCTIKGLVFSKIISRSKKEKITLEIQTISTKRINISKLDFDKGLFHDVDFEIFPLAKVSKDNGWVFNSEFKKIESK